MDYEPKFKKTVLKAGDEYAIHYGGKGGRRMGPIQVTADSQSNADLGIDDPCLVPWTAWLDEVDFDSLWDKKINRPGGVRSLSRL